MTRARPQTWHGGMILLPGGPARAHLVLRRGRIRKIVPGNRPAPGSRNEFGMAEFLVLPGLINAHDHLDFNCFPPCGPRRPYRNAVQWYEDVRSADYAATRRAVRSLPRKLRLLAGGFRNLLSGVTTAAHHNPPVRYLHRRRFPVHVPRGIGYCHSLATDPRPTDSLPRDRGRPWVIHAAEGTDRAAAAEVARLQELGCLRPGSVLVHCLGIDRATDPEILSASGAGMIWCPGSNDFLYQAVAPVRQLLPQTTVALGTDSAISGGGTMLDELRAARKAEPGLALRMLLEMATMAGARLFQLAPGRGEITAGSVADLVLFRLPADPGADPLLAPFEAVRPSLVVRDGIPLVGDASFHLLMDVLGLSPVEFELDGAPMVMPRRLHRRFARVVKGTTGRPPFFDAVRIR